MSERFEKTYISVSEFVTSWEKEIYELTNLDYFTYIIINYLGYQIEHEFLTGEDCTPYLKIDPDEVATLSFNIGDSFESFLENNCFGDCTLSCPTHLEDKVNPEEAELDRTHLNIIQIMNGSDLSKKQFLLTDILNYVVLDTLFDFYNYEIGLDLDDADIGLMQFADFITVILEKFIESKGQPFLSNPKDSAKELFEKILNDSEHDWEETPPSFTDESDEKEEWKHGNLSVGHVIQEYIAQLPDEDSTKIQLMEYFQTFSEEYAGIFQIDEYSKEDLEEFFLFWLLREISLEKDIEAEEITDTFEQFFIWLELARGIDLKSVYMEFISENHTALEKSLNSMRAYFEGNSLINGILEANGANDQVIDGFFMVENVTRNGFLRLRDIHFRQTYLNVKINLSDPAPLEKTILYAGIKYTTYGWRVINLEYIFPQKAKPYLH